MKNAESILGYHITCASKKECISEIIRWVESTERGRYLACANPHSLEVAGKDPDFEKALKCADIVVPDGIGIVVASWVLGGSIRDRITGYDVFEGLSEEFNRMGGYRYFFLGSQAETLARITRNMQADYPNIQVAGTCSPPFKPEFSDEDNEVMVEAVNRAKPDVLWVGMTAPKQEKWAYENRNRLDVKFIGPIGAVFDFYAGTVRRSHPWFRGHGLEWLPRLIQEPKRLWRRNFVSNPLFLYHTLKQKTSQSLFER